MSIASRKYAAVWLVLIAVGGSPLCSLAAAPSDEATRADFFERQVRPVLVQRCVKCHGAEKQSGGLRLDRAAAALGGGDSGPAIRPGKPDESLLVEAVRQTGEL